MRSSLVVLMMLLGCCSGTFAQRSHGFVVAGPGGEGSDRHLVQFATGGEGVLNNGIGIGAELGYLAQPSDLKGGIGVFSANGFYHFRIPSQPKIDPFVTGGYTLYFRSGSESGGNFGGGANFWLARHFGIKAEFRDHLFPGSGLSGYYTFRFGVAFR